MSSTHRSRHELERRGSRLRGHHGVDVACAIAAVLCAGRGVGPIGPAGGGFLSEGDVFRDAARPDPTFVTHLGGAEPGAAAPPVGTDVEVVAVTDDPDRHRTPQRAVASQWRDFQLICCANLVELVARPCGHWCPSFWAA